MIFSFKRHSGRKLTQWMVNRLGVYKAGKQRKVLWNTEGMCVSISGSHHNLPVIFNSNFSCFIPYNFDKVVVPDNHGLR